jgi:branched-chain amino acid transport system permease protein
MDGETSQAPTRPEQETEPQIGVDQWVADVAARREQRSFLRRTLNRVPPPFGLAIFVAFAGTLPLLLSEGNLFRYGLFTLLYALLGLGLNVTVGFAGLLDLGYIAFYGFGAYFYAILASGHFDIHWQAELTTPVVVVGAALLGLVLSLPSRRLLGDYLAFHGNFWFMMFVSLLVAAAFGAILGFPTLRLRGDYLAIVTLFFGQAFVIFVNAANPKGLTGGANGIAGVDPINFFGYKLTTTKDYYYYTLIVFVLVLAGLFLLSASRTGRAWRALREDPLAAEVMGMPVYRLKIMAFMFGAAIAGLTGTIFAANQTGVFPGDFDVSLLITIYAVVILGGIGSLAGMVIGAIVINVSFEILTPATPDRARWLFYLAILLVLVARTRPWKRLAVLAVGTVGFGFAVHALVAALSPSATKGAVSSGGFLTGVIKGWAVVPEHPGKAASYAYVGLVAAILALTLVHGWWRIAGIIPTLYLGSFVWENLLIEQPAVTRFILFGALLIALMSARPQGLLGTARVEIV